LQGCDIAVKRADADAEFVGERRAAHRPAAAATQRLDKIDGPFGALHF
jgi:hypothetical protein